MAANEGGIEVLRVGSTVFVGTVEGCSHLSFACLLVKIDGASARAF